MRIPAVAATLRLQAPAASTTTGAWISPRLVAIPFTRPFARSSSVTRVKGSMRAPSSAARAAKPTATLEGSSHPSDGTWPIARAAPGSKWGASACASAAEMSRASIPSACATAKSARSRASPASRIRRLEAPRPVEVDVAPQLGLEALERLAGLVPERGHDRRRGRLAGEPGRAGRRLGAHRVLIDEHHVCAAAREVVGSAGAERTSADHDRRRRLHGGNHSSGRVECSLQAAGFARCCFIRQPRVHAAARATPSSTPCRSCEYAHAAQHTLIATKVGKRTTLRPEAAARPGGWSETGSRRRSGTLRRNALRAHAPTTCAA